MKPLSSIRTAQKTAWPLCTMPGSCCYFRRDCRGCPLKHKPTTLRLMDPPYDCVCVCCVECRCPCNCIQKFLESTELLVWKRKGLQLPPHAQGKIVQRIQHNNISMHDLMIYYSRSSTKDLCFKELSSYERDADVEIHRDAVNDPGPMYQGESPSQGVSCL